MALSTYSAFYYGHNITESNQFINFIDDLSGEKTATLEIGSYTLTGFANELARALNAVGSQEYEVTVNRLTRELTIEADNNFDILAVGGSLVAISAWSLAGFTQDKTGNNSYTSDLASGFAYYPQILLQDFVHFDDSTVTNNVTVNESASGEVEVVGYGEVQFMECNITLATNIIPQLYIKENANGVDDLRQFMLYAIRKLKMEFIPDVNGGVFYDCILESTPEERNGTSFKLKELYARKLVGYFETGTLTFRRI
jgi:hypothetical protein